MSFHSEFLLNISTFYALLFVISLKSVTFAAVIILRRHNLVTAAFKNRTRDEIIAAVRESIRKKQEWIKQSDEEFKRIREERKRLQYEPA